ncbi:I66 family serine proteinase inhibitor [Kitasatospora sp. NPDC004799]|uniref:I66 family serine proteinase inhibitor n=1 Tax=Kitasatospora sp. NPDC004799 TaxID=3154460 RepID=UPI0033ADB776
MSSLETLRDRAVRIVFAGGGLAAIDGRAYAVLTPEPPTSTWRLVPDERTGKNHFVIVDEAEGFLKGLKLTDPEEGDAQVEVGPVPVGRSLPPFYPPNAVWVLEAPEGGEEGFYRLRNLASDTYIGRRAAEDRSLNPKPVVADPQPQEPEKVLALVVPA